MSVAARAYGASRTALAPRQLEADVFRRVTGAMRGSDGPMATTRALSDNRRLWLAVETAVSDPTNALPATLRAQLVSLGRAVLRELDAPEPDLDFLIEVNMTVAAGLAGG
ncbi:flagellar biosynthesis regulator FlaF [Roseomonas sp. BN140053]|uniref:flagellar biosynthesis regulator FlaF n=1 Tax=Roseomonas sp. BN140053 TaxID=3391898 RepID=UPI0039EA0530